MGERVDAVVVRDGKEASGVQAAIERVREGVADPVEASDAGTVLEGKDEDDASTGGRLRGERCGSEGRESEENYFGEATVEPVGGGCEGHRE